MVAKAIIPVLKDFKQQINNTNDRLIRQYCMMTRAHERYNRLFRQTHKTFQIHHLALLIVVLLHCGCLSLNPFIEFRIWNNSSCSDVLNIQASISISPKYESKSKTTSHCHLLLHDCTNVAV